MRLFNQWLKNDDYKKLLKNGLSLSLVQLSNYVLPLLTIPYLARVLGPNFFGLVMMAQATMIYLTLVTDYGFNLSATKEIAMNQSNPARVSSLFSTVMSIKIGLLFVGGVILAGLVIIIPTFRDHYVLFLSAYLIVIGNAFLPTFLFQGLEKMSHIALFNFIAKASFTGLIFWLIRSHTDYIWVHALWGISYIMVDIVAFYIIRNRLHIAFKRPQLNQIKSLLHVSFEYFLSRIAIAIYLNTNVIFVGILLTPAQAGLYGGAEKLLFAITTFYTPLIETIYPYISRTKNKSFVKKIISAAVGLNTFGCILAFLMAPWLIPLILGPAFSDAVPLFRWMLIIAFLHLPTSMIGYPVLGAMGYVKTANRSVIIGAIIHGLLVIILYQHITTPLAFIWIMAVSQFITFSIRCSTLIRIQKRL
ncbi:MAG: oligosaccharide flippase family protein [Candidatus Marinamargulisbacteria bacterium]